MLAGRLPAESAWEVVPNCTYAAIAQSLNAEQGGPVDTEIAEAWMAQYPQCARGYQGLLCANCEAGFGRGQAPYTCMECPRTRSSALVLVLAFFVIMAILAFTIRNTLLSSFKDEPAEAPTGAQRGWARAGRAALQLDPARGTAPAALLTPHAEEVELGPVSAAASAVPLSAGGSHQSSVSDTGSHDSVLQGRSHGSTASALPSTSGADAKTELQHNAGPVAEGRQSQLGSTADHLQPPGSSTEPVSGVTPPGNPKPVLSGHSACPPPGLRQPFLGLASTDTSAESAPGRAMHQAAQRAVSTAPAVIGSGEIVNTGSQAPASSAPPAPPAAQPSWEYNLLRSAVPPAARGSDQDAPVQSAVQEPQSDSLVTPAALQGAQTSIQPCLWRATSIVLSVSGSSDEHSQQVRLN